MSGKGDKTRKSQVSDKKFSDNWALIFKKDKQNERINKHKKGK